MQPHQQNASLLGLNVANMLHADHFGPASDATIGPEPGHSGFQQAHTDGFKIFDHHRMAFTLAHLGKTEFEVTIGNFRPTLHQPKRQVADHMAKTIENRIGQLHDQPK